MAKKVIVFRRKDGEWSGIWRGVRFTTNDAAERYIARNIRPAYEKAYDFKVVDEDDPLVILLEARSKAATMMDTSWTITPWHRELWYQEKGRLHFAHVSPTDPTKIEFYMNEKDLMRGRLTTMAPGRYLTRFFGDELTGKEIERLANTVAVNAKENELHVTQDPDEIVKIYENGPNSCMSGHGRFELKERKTNKITHPVTVYAGPDLGIAYLGTIEKPKARCVVWPEKKIYGRIYGDIDKLEILLMREGYERGSFDGARIRRLMTPSHPAHVILPYIDNPVVGGKYRVFFTPGEEFLTLGVSPGGESFEIAVTDSGTSGTRVGLCQREACDTEFEWSQATVILDNTGIRSRYYCPQCAETHAHKCEIDGYYYLNAEAVQEAIWAVDSDGQPIKKKVGARYYRNHLLKTRDGQLINRDYARVCRHGDLHYVLPNEFISEPGVQVCKFCVEENPGLLESLREAEAKRKARAARQRERRAAAKSKAMRERAEKEAEELELMRAAKSSTVTREEAVVDPNWFASATPATTVAVMFDPESGTVRMP